MAVRWIKWAFEQEDLSPAQKLVLIKLADNANDAGECWPSIDYIQRHTCLSRATVLRALKFLERIGVVAVTRQKIGSVNLPNRYELDWINKQTDSRGVVSQCDQGSVTVTPGGSVTVTPKPSPIEPSKNRQEEDPPLSDADKVIANWHILARDLDLPDIRMVTDNRRKLLNARLKEVGLDGFRTAFENARASPFVQGQNSRGWKMDFDFLLKPGKLVKLMEGAYGGTQD